MGLSDLKVSAFVSASSGLCFSARHLTLAVPLSVQVYKRVPAKLLTLEQPCDELASHLKVSWGGAFSTSSNCSL